ncbi:substrate-binding domain-containing protein [Actinoallomurus rhizosphaericola]|uniref:substrate-binding domain-containing protein n=1 Tax=Actinoallomurus rhizosphaericola TaxID=2952536 RepID=UPI0020924B33|nr:substrate-binding domain-containing protein [Actinoallomurus rhizosphaericola]MCO5998724.1 substrate-binding domain-containing protein [Actinoallomurus rhizosphaericola]
MAATRRDPRIRLLVVGAVLLLAGLSAGWYLLRDRPQACHGRALPVGVVAAPDITPALAAIAARFNVQPHEIGGRCAQIEVEARDPGTVARALAKGDRSDVDAWVPDSSMWLDRARAAGARTVGFGSPLAASPVVIAAPRAVAAELRDDGIAASWRLLENAPLHASVRVLDPARDAAGAAVALAVRATIGHVTAPHAPDPARLYASFAGLQDLRRPLVAASEQSVVAYNDAHRPNPASVIVPEEGTLLLDHPFVAVSTDPLRAQAVDAFRWALRGRQAVDTFQWYGFRATDGRLDLRDATRLGLRETLPKVLPAPTPAQVASAMRS